MLAVLLAGTGCSSPGTPEDQIRELVASAEESAEARDASELRGLVADDYKDKSGRDASDVRNLLHAWLVAHPSVNLLARVDSIEMATMVRDPFEHTFRVIQKRGSEIFVHAQGCFFLDRQGHIGRGRDRIARCWQSC